MLAEASEGLTAIEDPREILLEITDNEHDLLTDEERQAGRTLIDAAVRHLNGFGKLRWGRTYEGVTIKTVEYPESEGDPDPDPDPDADPDTRDPFSGPRVVFELVQRVPDQGDSESEEASSSSSGA